MDCRKTCSIGCSCVSLVISAILAAVIGVLFFFKWIPNIAVVTWIAFGLGVLTLLILFFTLLYAAAHPCSALPGCLCRHGKCLLLGSAGTIVSTLATIAIALSLRSIFAVFFVAIGAFFTVLMLLALISLILCVLCALCGAGK